MEFHYLVYVFVSLDTLLASSKGGTVTFLFPSSTTFFVPNDTYRLRVLAVGGGGGGCGGIKREIGKSGDVAVNIVHVSGPAAINVSVGRGGLGAKDHSVESISNGGSSHFGNYLAVSGGLGCSKSKSGYSLSQLKGIRHLRMSKITKGVNGESKGSSLKGGEGGILINGSGPSGKQGGSDGSAFGGTGYGAGGGGGGALYLHDGSVIYPGGTGAEGVVYIEMQHSVCSGPVDIIFAVESRHSQSEFDQQLTFIQNIIKSFKISLDNVRVALITYGNEAHLKFGFHEFMDLSNLLNEVSSIKNDLKESAVVHFAKLYETALITFDIEGRTSVLSSKAFIVLTFAENVTQNDSMQNLVSSAVSKGILMSVVAMRNKSKEEDFLSLVEDKQNVLTGEATNITNKVPWIVDLICQAPSARKSDFSSTAASLLPSTSEVVASSSLSNNVTSLYWHTPLVYAENISTETIYRHSSAVATITVSATVLVKSSVHSRNNSRRTVEELERDLDDVLSFNVSLIDPDDIVNVKSYISLAGDLLAESHRIPNASERGIEFMLVKKVETIGLTVAEQLVPTSAGYKTKALSSGKVDIEVASVNLTQLEQLSLPDNPNGSYEVSSLEQIGKVVIPLEAFASNTSVLGQAVWMMFDPLTAMDDSAEIVVRSRIMNIVVKPHRTQEIERPVEMTFWPSQDIQSNVDCVFWDQGQKNNHGNWSTEGCQVSQRNSSTVTCHCNHLTSFAVLTRVTPHQPSKEHELPLSIITYVGCGLSVLGCLLTILTYAFLPSVRSQRILIHINLVTALVVAQVLFLVAAFAVSPQTSRMACYVIAVGLFFFLLCVFSWMLAEGLHIYFMVVRVFDSGRTRKLFYLLIGWGFPFIVTAVVVSVFQRGLLSKDLCWLSIETGAIWSFIGPVIFVMLFNLVIATMVMSATSRMLNEETPSNVRSLTKAFVTLLPILGLTWVFGLLAVNNDSVLFEYLFAILNSLQGFFIFLFYCLKNSEVRREFKRKLHNLRAQRHPSQSSNPSNTPKCTPAETEAPGPCTQQENITRDRGFETRL